MNPPLRPAQPSTGDSVTELLATNYFAALIDILGTQEELRKVTGPYEDEAHFMRGADGMRKAADKVHALRGTALQMCSVVRAAGEQLREVIPSYGALNLHTFGFGDTTVLYYSLGRPTQGEAPIMQGVPIGLATVSLLMLASLANKVPLRGAIEVEMGCELYPEELFGRVLQTTHEMETTTAQTVRIVIGPVLSAMIEQGKILPAEASNNYLVERRLAARAGSFISRDPSDGLFVLDYLGAAKTIMGNQPLFAEQTTKALAFLIQQEEYWTRLMRLDRAVKYRAAIVYFASRGIQYQPAPKRGPDEGHISDSTPPI